MALERVRIHLLCVCVCVDLQLSLRACAPHDFARSFATCATHAMTKTHTRLCVRVVGIRTTRRRVCVTYRDISLATIIIILVRARARHSSASRQQSWRMCARVQIVLSSARVHCFVTVSWLLSSCARFKCEEFNKRREVAQFSLSLTHSLTLTKVYEQVQATKYQEEEEEEAENEFRFLRSKAAKDKMH